MICVWWCFVVSSCLIGLMLFCLCLVSGDVPRRLV